jgi:hypothetical protein
LIERGEVKQFGEIERVQAFSMLRDGDRATASQGNRVKEITLR